MPNIQEMRAKLRSRRSWNPKKEKNKFASRADWKKAIREVEHMQMEQKTANMLLRVAMCKEWESKTVRGEEMRVREACKSPLCPSCAEHQKEELVQKVCEKFTSCDHHFMSLITLDSSSAILGDDLTDLVHRDRQGIKYRLEQLGQVKAWFHFQLKTEGEEIKPHWHGILFHEGITQDQVKEEFKKSFGGHKAVDLKPFYKLLSKEESIRNIVNYASRIDTRGIMSSKGLVRYVDSLTSLLTRGRQGMILEYGLKERTTKVVSGTRPVEIDHEWHSGGTVRDELRSIDDVGSGVNSGDHGCNGLNGEVDRGSTIGQKMGSTADLRVTVHSITGSDRADLVRARIFKHMKRRETEPG
ncbi:MAG TPA: hypothetical protein VM577_21060 [Anaerovoracaceae bacterium]|nr:hypothetical protein [Anaerovoracaceae bacterium]